MSDLIVLTCASGKQCSAIVPSLAAQPSRYQLRLVVNSEKSQSKLQAAWPSADVQQGNLTVLADCSRILDGATTVYHVGPPMHPEEFTMGKNMIDAAVQERQRSGSKLEHFIFSSVIHPEISTLKNHECKLKLEEYLHDTSGLPWTILQPSHFLENTLSRLVALKTSPTPTPEFVNGHRTNIPFSFSILRDTSDASVKVIRERQQHFYATYQLASTLPTTYDEYIAIVGEIIGKDIQVKVLTAEQAVEAFKTRVVGGDDPRVMDSLERLIGYYNRHGLVGNVAITECLLGRKATGIREAVEKAVGALAA